MNPRLIPWCLAATGFLAAFTTFTWHGSMTAPRQESARQQLTPGQPLLPSAALRHYPAASQEEPASPAPAPLILPLPPATQPQMDSDVQPVPDDQPTVDDLPAPRSPPDSAANE
jgi:hypothetical protein